MTSLARKALADFWRGRGRSLPVALAIALGVAAFAALLATYAVLTREITRGYLATRPATATLWTDAVDDALLAQVRLVPGVADAEARRALRGRLRVGPGEWRDLTLFVVRDFADLRIAKLVPETGAWPPAAGEILIERDAMQVARAALGEEVAVRLGGGEPLPLRLAGTVHDVGQAQARMEVAIYGYVALDTLARLGERPVLDRLMLVASDARIDRAGARALAEAVGHRLAQLGHPVSKIDVPVPGEHPHAAIMGMLLLAQASFGLFALALAGILVVNLMTARLAAEVRQVGAMKAIGGASSQIARIYLAEALLLGATAIVLALPLAVLGERALCRTMASFLNFDVTSFAAPAWVWVLGILAGLGVPLAAAILPVWRGASRTVRAALADYGVAAGRFGERPIERRLAAAGGLPSWLLLALRNPLRRRGRAALAVATFAVGGVVFLTAANLRLSLERTIDGLFERQRFDVTVVFSDPVPRATVAPALAGLGGLERWEGWLQTQATVEMPAPAAAEESAGTAPGAPHDEPAAASEPSLRAIALPPDSALLLPRIVAGRGLAAGERASLVANEALVAADPRFAVGRDVTLRMFHRAFTLRVVGVAREALTPPTVYLPIAEVEAVAAYAGTTNSLRLLAARREPRAIAALESELDAALERAGLRPLATRTQGELRHGYDEHVVMIYVFLTAVAAIVLAVAGLGLATGTALAVLERRREMGVLRVLGATPARVAGLVAAEGAALAAVAWAAALLAAWPIGLALGTLLSRAIFRGSFRFLFAPRALLVWAMVSLAIGVVASWIPARLAARRPIREAIDYE